MFWDSKTKYFAPIILSFHTQRLHTGTRAPAVSPLGPGRTASGWELCGSAWRGKASWEQAEQVVPVTGSVGGWPGRRRAGPKVVREKAGPWAEAGSASVAHLTELLRSPWGLCGGEVTIANWQSHLKFVTKKVLIKTCRIRIQKQKCVGTHWWPV